MTTLFSRHLTQARRDERVREAARKLASARGRNWSSLLEGHRGRHMIHHHGTPVTPREMLYRMRGCNFCVAMSDPRDLDVALAIGQIVMGDSGAFTAFLNGASVNWDAYFAWLRPWLRPPHWAVAPDVIGGDVNVQRDALRLWPFPRRLAGAVWHIHLPLDYLRELANEWPRVCFGSSGALWQLGTDAWRARLDRAWNILGAMHDPPPVHILRAMYHASEGPWPFASADSVNVARNFKCMERDPAQMAREIDGRNPPASAWVQRPEQRDMLCSFGTK